MDSWINVFTMVLLIPIIMIVFGIFFIMKPPKKIRWFIGYRTIMSTKNQETWDFANNHFARVWFYCGIIFFVMSIVFLLFMIGKDINDVVEDSLIFCLVQVGLMVLTIIPTELALKRKFNKDGTKNK